MSEADGVPAGPAGPADPAAERRRARQEAERRRRLAEVFGEVLPDTTADEREPSAGSSPGEGTAGDRWLREQVPPHHG